MDQEGGGGDNHFVPQFYLRYWSSDEKSTNLFNFRRMLAIPDASIKGQCQRHNFYSFAPKLEAALANLEGETAEVVRTLNAAGDVPRHGSEDWLTLLRYIGFQKLRTSSANYMSEVFADQIARLWVDAAAEYGGSAPEVENWKSIRPLAIAMSVIGQLLEVASDLRMHLFVNETTRQFLTSDDPVVMHNQYCEGITYLGVSGWSNSGVQVFFPLSPRALLLLFDPSIYKVGRSHRGSTATRISDEESVMQLNSLQIMNAQHNVYFASFADPEKAMRECRSLAARRPKTRYTFVEAEGVEADGKESTIMHGYEPLLPIRLTISAIKIRKRPRQVPLDHRATMYRKEVPRTEAANSAFGAPPVGIFAVKKIANV